MQPIVDFIYSQFPTKLYGYFVYGAPATLTENIAPHKGLANGTAVVLEGLTLASSEDQTQPFPSLQQNHNQVGNVDICTDEDRVQQALPGEIVTLTRPPLAIHVQLLQGHPTANYSSWPISESIRPGSAVIPLVSKARPKSFVQLGN